jgi:ornithine cyclodeaminase/alanine dehydrogenase-like protein (mu-crystallin family)
MPLRSHIDVPEMGTSLVMPAYLEQNGALAVKVVSVFPKNVARELPVVNALVMVLDVTTGQPVALMEGSALTAIRTGAGSGAATDLLARRDAKRAAIIGTGVQARTQLEAVCTARNIQEVSIFSPDFPQAEMFAREMAGKGSIPAAITISGRTSFARRPRHPRLFLTAVCCDLARILTASALLFQRCKRLIWPQYSDQP